MPKNQMETESSQRRTLRALAIGGLSALLAVGLVACSDDGDDSDATDATDTMTATATMTETATGTETPTATLTGETPTAVPHVTIDAEIIDGTSEDVEINAGDSITWSNSDDEARTISGDGFEDTTIEPGETFTHEFTSEGTYDVTIEGGETFTVTVLSGLQPEAQGTGVPHEPTSTPAN